MVEGSGQALDDDESEGSHCCSWSGCVKGRVVFPVREPMYPLGIPGSGVVGGGGGARHVVTQFADPGDENVG